MPRMGTIPEAAPWNSRGVARHGPEEAIRRVIEGITNGQSLRTICQDRRMPSASTIFEWLASDERLSDQYARARESSGLLVGEEIEEIARQVLRGEIDANAARVALDALKWTAARKAPRVYGESLKLTGQVEVGALVAFVDMNRADDEDAATGTLTTPHTLPPEGSPAAEALPETA